MPNNASLNELLVANEVEAIIARFTKKTFTHDSEIYYDLGIYGEDLFDIFEQLIAKYAVDFSGLNAAKIAPGEGGGGIGWLARRLGFRPFRSFKVRDLIDYTVRGATQKEEGA